MLIATVLLSLAPNITATIPALEGTPTPKPAAAVRTSEIRQLALGALRTALPEGLDAKDEVRAMVRRTLAAQVALGKDSAIAGRLGRAAEEALRCLDEQTKAAALLVTLVTEDAMRDLAFEPLIEAPLPKGFPWPVPAGEIALQEYPRYRRVRAAMDGGQNGPFFKLFRHITSNDIPMTAPVEMTLDGDEMVDMSFLYENPEVGSAGEAGLVEVVDSGARTVVSIGIRGEYGRNTIRDATALIDAWLAGPGKDWKKDGAGRLMGYNSPMVPRNRKFHEVQVPVVKR